MSEFSESYHLRGEGIEEGVALLRRAGLKGYVFPPENGWISMVAEQNSFEPDQRITSQNRGTLLHFFSAEDHGWGFAVFEDEKVVCAYTCGWDDDVRIDDSQYSAAVLARVLGADGPQTVAAIEKILHPDDIDVAIDSEPGSVFAEALHLPHYEWFAYDYVDGSFHERPAEYSNVIKVI